MSNKVVLISGTDFNINGICEIGELNAEYVAEVVKFNRFGYIGIRVNGKEDLVRRHLSDCEDVRSMSIGHDLRNLVYKNDRWVVINSKESILSEPVYVIKVSSNEKSLYIARSTINGKMTYDITKAWFTFVKEQAVNYANKMTVMTMSPYIAIDVEKEISLQHYV